MSDSNRYQRSPNPKIARYLHRIEQLVGHRNKSPSPLSSRVLRPIKPHSLDSFLKYQLTFKILIRFFQKYNREYHAHFFNNLRAATNHQKAEKIYRFVSIEKTQCAHLHADSNISSKILCNSLRNYHRGNLKAAFLSIKRYQQLSDSIFINTPRSLLATPPHSARNKTSRPQAGQNSLKIFLLLEMLFTRKKLNAFYSIFLHSKRPKRTPDPATIFMMVTVLSKAQANRKRQFFRVLKNQTEDSRSCIWSQKIKHLSSTCWMHEKNKIIQTFRAVHRKTVQYQMMDQIKFLKAELGRHQKVKVHAQVSTQDLNHMDERINQAMLKITSSLLSIILRGKAHFFKNLQTIALAKKNQCEKIARVFMCASERSEMEALTKLKANVQQQYQIQERERRQQHITSAVKSYFVLAAIQTNTKRTVIDRMLAASALSIKQEQLVARMIICCYKLLLRKGFRSIYRQSIASFQSERRQNQQQRKQQIQNIAKAIHRLHMNRMAEAFINITVVKRPAEKKKTACDWRQDMNAFLAERKVFRKNLEQNVKKVDSILKEHQNIGGPRDRSPMVLNSPKRALEKARGFPSGE